VFNKVAPFNPYTYGALNYNSAFTQSGAVGRFMTVGARYKF
jgi:iron complex outermembrane recepter protein